MLQPGVNPGFAMSRLVQEEDGPQLRYYDLPTPRREGLYPDQDQTLQIRISEVAAIETLIASDIWERRLKIVIAFENV